MSTRIEEFLSMGGSLDALKSEYGINHKRHTLFPNLVQFKYNQLESPMDKQIVREARGLILDESRDWRTVARPFNKFFNHGEVGADTIDWGKAKVQEKLDGSLIILYYYNCEWHVATLGSPDASGHVGDLGITFAELFWTVFKEKGYKAGKNMSPRLTYLFELMTPYNRVVVNHQTNDIKLVGTIYSASGNEISIDTELYFDAVDTFSLTTMNDILKTFDAMDPLQQEGYVIVDDKFQRVKVKHPGYVALHRLKDGFSVKRVLELVRIGEASEVVAHFPEWRVVFDHVTAAYDALVTHLEVEYSRLKNIVDQKEFALEVTKCVRVPSILFMLRSQKIKSVKEGLNSIHIDGLVRHLGIKYLKVGGYGCQDESQEA